MVIICCFKVNMPSLLTGLLSGALDKFLRYGKMSVPEVSEPIQRSHTPPAKT